MLTGDVVALLDTTGEVTKRYDYDAFGNELNLDNEDTNPFRYCGEYCDAESGQIYLRNRYYQPVTGRFSQLDPIKDGVNWYAYCLNNPVKFIDPSGCVIVFDGTTEEKTELLVVLNSLVDGYISYDSETGVVSLSEGISDLYPKGTELVQTLIDSEYVITIKLDSGSNGADYENEENAGNGVGSNGTVYFNPNSYPEVLTINPENGGRSELMSRPNYIGLGHELVHAYGYITGTRSGENEIYYEHYYLNSEGVGTQNIERKEELMTVGLIPGRPITENDLRSEHGLYWRGAY